MITPDFTVGQVLGTPANIVLTNTATGSDVTVVALRVYLYTNLGTTLVPSGISTAYNDWPLADATLTIVNVLPKDYSLNVNVQWVDANGDMVVEKTILTNFNMYNQLYNYSLVYNEANGLASLNSPNWFVGRMGLYLSLNDSDTSITDMSSIGNGQSANDRGTYIRENPNLLY